MKVYRWRAAALAMLAALLATGAALSTASASTHSAKATTIVIWADASRTPPMTQLANAWAAANGATIKVVNKGNDPGVIRSGISTVAAADAPDIIVGAHDWTGELAANGVIEPLYPSAAIRAQFPKYTLDAFSYGTAVKKVYGMPTTIENIGLLVNTKLVPKVPSTFAQLEATALKFKRQNHLAFGICVQQGAGGDAYHMYPFFSGLGGYIFGVNKAGNLDASDIGVANPTFLKNAPLIDKWNKEGLVNSKADYSTCNDSFTKGKAPFWITGPWAVGNIQKAGVKFRVVQIPRIAQASVPFLGVQGVMVTKYASVHNVDAAAKDLVVNYFSRPAAQAQFSTAGGRPPANLKAASNDPVLRQFSAASKGGVPMPNIPQMASVWTDLGQAWVRSTKGSGAMPARRSFTGAAKAIATKIG